MKRRSVRVPRTDNQRAAFQFLRQHAEARQPFMPQDLKAVTGWSDSSVRTYMSKQFSAYVQRKGRAYRVSHEFLRVTEEEFLGLVSQTRRVHTLYQREKFENVVTFEFLLPLTQEGKLRRALDDLFYSDTVRRRVLEIGLAKMEQIVPRPAEISEDAYIDDVCRIVSDRFGGYSIGHVNGRFRAADLVTRSRAGELLAGDQTYLVDETTAVVRFIVPCQRSRVVYGDDFDSMGDMVNDPDDMQMPEREIEVEVQMIRSLFFHLFVEAVVTHVQGEEAIWLLEAGSAQRLYVWNRRRSFA